MPAVAGLPSPAVSAPVTAPVESLPAAADAASVGSDGPPSDWPDDAAESAFRAEAKDRGETVVPTRPVEEEAEPADNKPLPPLSDLVNRIPPEVRDALDDLFRARFVTVKRVPAKALKR
jgi:hypothetical protein